MAYRLRGLVAALEKMETASPAAAGNGIRRAGRTGKNNERVYGNRKTRSTGESSGQNQVELYGTTKMKQKQHMQVTRDESRRRRRWLNFRSNSPSPKKGEKHVIPRVLHLQPYTGMGYCKPAEVDTVNVFPNVATTFVPRPGPAPPPEFPLKPDATVRGQVVLAS